MKRTVYEAPTTERIRIELESDFMTASVVNDKNKGDVDAGQELNIIDEGTVNGWNESPWE